MPEQDEDAGELDEAEAVVLEPRDLTASPGGMSFDIQFRVIDAATSAVVLISRCYQFTVNPE